MRNGVSWTSSAGAPASSVDATNSILPKENERAMFLGPRQNDPVKPHTPAHFPCTQPIQA